MRGSAKDSIWLFMGVVLIFAIMATFSPTSTMGKAFLSMRRSIEGAFGGEVGYCPFINPYAMSIYSAGELVVTSGHPLCIPIDVALGTIPVESVTSDTVCSAKQYSLSIEPALAEDCSGYGSVPDWDGEERVCVTITSIKEGTGSTSTVDDEETKGYDPDIFFQNLAELQIQEENLGKDNLVAIQLLSEKRPMWQCFFIFGLLPFFITYYLLNDILTFAYLRTNTRRLIAIFAALLAILTGAFANIITAVSSFVGLSIGQSFLLAIFSLALLTVFLGQLTVTAGVAQTTVNAVQKAVTGALVLTNLASATQDKQQQER